MKPDDHAGKHVYGERQPRPLIHRLSGLFVDQENVDLGVVDLHDLKRSRHHVLTWNRLRGFDALQVLTLQGDRSPVNMIDARLDGSAVGKAHAFSRAPGPHLFDQICHRRAFGLQVNLAFCGFGGRRWATRTRLPRTKERFSAEKKAIGARRRSEAC